MEGPHKRTKLSNNAVCASTTLDSLQAVFDDPAYNTPRYRITRVMGSGTYGNVVSARLGNGPNLAVKIVENKTYGAVGVGYDILRELCILQLVSHHNVQNIIKLRGWFSHGDSRFFYLMELGERSLRGVIQASTIGGKFIAAPLEITRQRTLDIMNGLFTLNFFGIFHRDLKPDNVIVFGAGRNEVLKITDFGMSRTLLSRHSDVPTERLAARGFATSSGYYMLDAENQALTEHTGTRWYRAPEIILGSLDYDSRVDTWGLGVMITELETGVPFCGCNNEYEVWIAATQAIGTPTEKSWPGVSKLPEYSSEFPKFRGKPNKNLFARSDGQKQPGWFIKLCKRMLVMNPARRVRPIDAMHAMLKHR